MNARTKKLLDGVVCRFIASNFESANCDNSVAILDVMERFEDYRLTNAAGYAIDSTDVLKKIKYMFPESKADDIRICGIARKPQKVKPAKKIPTEDEKREMLFDSEMETRFRKFVYNRSINLRTEPFSSKDLAEYCQVLQAGNVFMMDVSEVSIPDAEKWLSKQDYLYFDDKINMWCFHKR